MRSQAWRIALIALAMSVSACGPTKLGSPPPPPSIAPPDPELMIPPSGADLPILPPAEIRRASDYEDAYFAMLDVHTPVAVRLGLLQDWARRVVERAEGED